QRPRSGVRQQLPVPRSARPPVLRTRGHRSAERQNAIHRRTLPEPEPTPLAATIAAAPAPIALLPLPLLDSAVVILFLTLISGAFVPILVEKLVSPQAPKWAFYFLIYALGGVMAAQRWRLVAGGIRANPGLLFMIGMALSSTFWSVLPGETLAASFTLMGPMLFAVMLAAAVRPEEALRLMAMACFCIVVCNWIAIVAVPSVGIEQHGPWVGTPRGLHVQKNALGATAALTLTAFAIYFASDPRGRRLWVLVGFALGVGLLIASRSTTSTILGISGVAMLFLPRLALRFGALALPTAIGAIAFAFAVSPELSGRVLETLAPLVGKDATMSNRLPIWQILMGYLEARPWLGYGYGVFWNDSISPALLFERRLGFDPGSAHNGLIEVWLAIGLVGVAGCIAALVRFFFLVARALKVVGATPMVRLAFSIGVLQIAHNVTESAFLQRNDFEWMLFVWVWAAVGVALVRSKTSTA
ncbi:MAG: hypothetical protein RL291_824, partial [Pseudomonadota bacterium]